MSQPSPADSGPADAGNALTPSETVLLELLKSLDMESLFPVFKGEQIGLSSERFILSSLFPR